MASGVAVDDDCVNIFQELKLGHKFRYLIYRLSDDLSKIIVDKTAPPSADYQSFLNELPKDECRYVIYDFEFQVEGAQRNKIIFILW
jgi:cofilin